MAKIYTRTGDKGETGLWGGGRISKYSARIHAYGTVDECNAVLGLIQSDNLSDELKNILADIQNLLFILGGDLATPGNQKTTITRIADEDISCLERWIDKLEKDLPKLTQFIIPGGCPAAAQFHLARTVCRRAERWAVALAEGDQTHEKAVIFLNRLSDFLFVAARTANQQAGLSDVLLSYPKRA